MSGYGAVSALVDGPSGRRLGLETATALTPTALSSGRSSSPASWHGRTSSLRPAGGGGRGGHDVRRLRPGEAAGEPRPRRDRERRPAAVRVVLRRATPCTPDSTSCRTASTRARSASARPTSTSTSRYAPRSRRMGGRAAAPVGRPATRCARHADDAHVERKVPLPDRWVRGFAEIPTSAGHDRRAELDGAAIARLARELPRSSIAGPELHLMPGRAASACSPARCTVRDPRRTRLAGRTASCGSRPRLTPRRPDGATAWRFELPGRAPHPAPDRRGPTAGSPARGRCLSCPTPTARRGRALLAHLAWDPLVDPDGLAAASDTTPRSTPAWPGCRPRGGWASTSRTAAGSTASCPSTRTR